MSVIFDQSETKINLMRAFAGESQARNRYTFAAAQALDEGFAVLEKVFDFTGEQEMEHGEIFYEYLQREVPHSAVTIEAAYPVDDNRDVLSLLKASAANEFEEAERIYPGFAAVAEKEGFPNIADHFARIAKIEQTHGERFTMFAQLLETDRLFKSEKETAWLCLKCGNIHYGKEAPMVCPVCGHNRGWYVRRDLAPFTM